MGLGLLLRSEPVVLRASSHCFSARPSPSLAHHNPIVNLGLDRVRLAGSTDLVTVIVKALTTVFLQPQRYS